MILQKKLYKLHSDPRHVNSDHPDPFLVWGTHGVGGNPGIAYLCANGVRNFFDFPKDVKNIWISFHTRPATHRASIGRVARGNRDGSLWLRIEGKLIPVGFYFWELVHDVVRKAGFDVDRPWTIYVQVDYV
jgi:hypothetical protein